MSSQTKPDLSHLIISTYDKIEIEYDIKEEKWCLDVVTQSNKKYYFSLNGLVNDLYEIINKSEITKNYRKEVK